MASTSNYTDRMKRNVDGALSRAQQVLSTSKHPVMIAVNVPHAYQDKYRMAEFLANTASSALLTCLFHCGMTAEHLSVLKAWTKDEQVSLRFQTEERCKFVKEVKRDVDSKSKAVVEVGGVGVFSSKVVTTVTEYIYEFSVAYRIVAFAGTGEAQDRLLELSSRSARSEITTSTNAFPHPEVRMSGTASFGPHAEVIITPLLSLIEPDASGSFRLPVQPQLQIDRSRSTCHTPRRNEEVERLLSFFLQMSRWCGSVASYFMDSILPVQQNHGLDLSALRSTSSVFVPVLPLLVEDAAEAGGDGAAAAVGAGRGDTLSAGVVVGPSGSSGLAGAVSLGGEDRYAKMPRMLQVEEANAFLWEQQRSLVALFGQIDAILPGAAGPVVSGLISAVEGKLVVTMRHAMEVVRHYEEGVQYLEEMLRQQLVAAIGKEVTESDFKAYMRFHNNKLFLAAYQPRPFCYAVRRSDEHAPEGVLSIEQAMGAGEVVEPVYTVVSRTGSMGKGAGAGNVSGASGSGSGVSGAAPMEFAISAATSISFTGERYLHAYLDHSFDGYGGGRGGRPELTLRAEARQFSSFIVLLGRIASATSFVPKHAMIVSNKDQIKIPLELETIPSAKEFREAIQSLSEEQQRFAQAYRSMQLESTLFGVCVIQIRPQLEKVLQLPAGSLTKEIRLTQELMELFIKYQIPSDLLSYAAEDDWSMVSEIEGGEGPSGPGASGGSGGSGSGAGAGAGTVAGGGRGGGGVSVRDKVSAVKGHVAAMYEMIEGMKKKDLEERKQEADFACHAGISHSMGSCTDESSCAVSSDEEEEENADDLLDLNCVENADCVFSELHATEKIMNRNVESFEHKASKGKVNEEASTQSRPTARKDERSTIATAGKTLQLTGSGESHDEGNSLRVIDYTKLPKLMDAQFEALDKEGSVRPTIIHPGKVWRKRAQKSIVLAAAGTGTGNTGAGSGGTGGVVECTLDVDAQAAEKNAAFELLDALSRSGGLSIEHASLHVVLASTHCFDRSVMDTLVQRNVNPIEKAECSTLIMAGLVHGAARAVGEGGDEGEAAGGAIVPAIDLVRTDQVQRLQRYVPMLMDAQDDSDI